SAIKKSLEKNIDENIFLEQSIERTTRDIGEEKRVLENKEKSKIENIRYIDEAKKSLEIVEENSENYCNYIKIQDELGRRKKDIITLEEKIEVLRKKEGDIKKIENKALEINGEIDKEKIHIESNRVNYEKSLKEKVEQEKNIFLANSRESELEIEEGIIAPLIENGEKLEKEIRKLEQFLQIEEAKILEDRKNYTELNKKLESYRGERVEEKLDELQELDKKKVLVESEISKIIALLENNREAEEKLSTSICPYLDEKCKNIESSSDSNMFFEERERRFKELLESNKMIARELQKSLEPLESLKKMLRESEIVRDTVLNLERLIEKKENEIRINELLGENLSLQRDIFEKEHGDLENLYKRKIAIKEERKYLGIKDIQKKIEEISILMYEMDRDYNIFCERKTNLEKDRDSSIEKIKTLENEIKDFPIYEEKLKKSKNDLSDLEMVVENIKISYDLYNRNIAEALKLQSYHENDERLKDSIDRVEFGIKKLEENLQKLREELSGKISIESLRHEKISVENRMTDLHRESGSLLNMVRDLQEKAKKAEKDYLEIEELEEQEKKLQKKIELTGKFRDNVKGMGEKVAQSIIRKIAFFATENFRKITGRGESIIWSGKDSSEKDSPYSVLLEGADCEGNLRRVNFDQLSGGEQVAVAISIRGAMNSIFTKTGFSIFDEPTNNLDKERRKILADNIGEILQNMEQSIIVTHDDTFKEMAQQVIEL
ncbi:MAG: hypothetical protein ACRCZ9_11440, partial [Fusobacteriaceae bacterium]